MPNRVVREGILDSDRVNELSWAGEVFYRRLMSVVDDFGRYESRTSVLRSKLYPIKIDKVSESDVGKWLTECVDAGLVRLYTVNKKGYLELLDFNQTVRIKKSKYPPPEHAAHMQADVKHMSAETNPIQSESGLETESNPNPAVAEGLGEKVKKEKPKEEWKVEFPWPDEEFQKKWEVWKLYRLTEKRQKFKTQMSEQAQLKHLHEMAAGDMQTAMKIIDQSIGNGWQGLFQLKNIHQNANKQQTGKTPLWRQPNQNS